MITKRYLLRITSRVFGGKAELQELACVLYAFLWGSLILIYEVILGRKTLTGVVFEKMELFAPGLVWGVVFFSFGLWGLIGYILDINSMRRIGAMFGVIGWTIIAYFMYTEFKPAFGVITVTLSAIFSMLSFIRLGVHSSCPK